MKMVSNQNDAKTEAENWTAIYEKYCEQFKWKIRMELWMGIPTVIMPRLNQFITKEERLDNLNAVGTCLRQFHDKGYVHHDIYWRNIGYLMYNGAIVVIALDLHPARVYKQETDGSWIDDALAFLKNRANLSPQ